MKKIIIASLFAISSSAFALDFPTTNNWAIAMTADACGLSLQSLEGATGEITEVEGGVVYTVTDNGRVIAKAFAKNTFIFAKKVCL